MNDATWRDATLTLGFVTCAVSSTPIQRYDGSFYDTASCEYMFSATNVPTWLYAPLRYGAVCADGSQYYSDYNGKPVLTWEYNLLSWPDRGGDVYCPVSAGGIVGFAVEGVQYVPGGTPNVVPDDTSTLTWLFAPLATTTSASHGVNAGFAVAPLAPIALKVAKLGVSPLDVCEEGSEAPAATHLEDTTTSDQTNSCIQAIAAPGSDAEKIARGLAAMRATGAAAGVAVTAWVVYELLHTTDTHPQPDPGPNPNPSPGPSPTPVPTPAPLPPPLPGATELQLITRRIAAAEPQLDPATVKTAARKCLDEEAAAGDTSQPCLTLPLFFPGLDAEQAAAHDATVISKVPAWFRLTYMSPTDKSAGVKRDWYKATAYNKECPPSPSLRDAECDEYPFYSTVEGGLSAYAVTKTVLQEIAAADNNKEGHALRSMQYDPDCHMATSAGNVKDFPGSGSQQFLVIPMVFPVSDHICVYPAAG